MNRTLWQRKGLPGTSQVFRLSTLLSSLAVLYLSLACGAELPPTTAPAPTLAPLSTSTPAPATSLTPLVVEPFDTGVEGWFGWPEEGAGSEVTWDPAGQLLWSIRPQPAEAVALAREWPALGDADGLTIRLSSRDRFAFLILGVQEADGSSYGLVLPLSAGQAAEHSVPFEAFGLVEDSEDENGRLDPVQLTALSLVDISGFLARASPTQVAIDEIVLWSGTVAPFDWSCSAPGPAELDAGFRVGVDANYVPQGEQPGRGFWVGGQSVDPLELFAVNGASGFRVRLWLGDGGESRLAYATELARRAQEVGLRPYLAIFLSDGWADINKQPAPSLWVDLSLEERAEAIRQYTRETAQHFLDQSIDLDFYEIGNEIDYGVCGVYADATHPRDPASLRDTIWPDEARLIRAAIDGVRETDPDARFLLHIATVWDPDFTVAFFQEMTSLGVEYDYVGLSYYPSAFGVTAADQFCATLDRLSPEVGKPIVLAETAYPAQPPAGELFGDWRHPLPGYPLTPGGQASWLADLLAAMRGRGDVVGVYYFGPGYWFSGELWGPFALFDGDGSARPAVASFRTDG